MTKALLRYIVRPAGPDISPITFAAFLSRLKCFSAQNLVAGFNQFSWQGWRGEFQTKGDNLLAVVSAPALAALGLAGGAPNESDPTATLGDIIDLHYYHLAINAASESLLLEHQHALARAAIGTDLAILVPNLQAARVAATACAVARIVRIQLLPSRSSLDELSKTWWIARRLDRDADQLRRATRCWECRFLCSCEQRQLYWRLQ